MARSTKKTGTEEVRVAISGDLNKYLDALVSRGLFTSKAELARFAIIEYLKDMPDSLPSSIQLKAPVKAPTPSQAFSPEGRIFQIEYAWETVNRAPLAIGILCNEGIALAKIISTGDTTLLDLEEVTSHSYCKVDEHIAIVGGGLAADLHILNLRAVKEAQEKRQKGEKVRVGELISILGAYTQSFTQKIDYRPLGVSILLGGIDETGLHLYNLGPSGAYSAVKGWAIGLDAANMNKSLAEKYEPNISLHDLEILSATALHRSLGKPILPEQVRIAVIPTKTGMVEELSIEQKATLLKNVSE